MVAEEWFCVDKRLGETQGVSRDERQGVVRSRLVGRAGGKREIHAAHREGWGKER